MKRLYLCLALSAIVWLMGGSFAFGMEEDTYYYYRVEGRAIYCKSVTWALNPKLSQVEGNANSRYGTWVLELTGLEVKKCLDKAKWRDGDSGNNTTVEAMLPDNVKPGAQSDFALPADFDADNREVEIRGLSFVVGGHGFRTHTVDLNSHMDLSIDNFSTQELFFKLKDLKLRVTIKIPKK